MLLPRAHLQFVQYDFVVTVVSPYGHLKDSAWMGAYLGHKLLMFVWKQLPLDIWYMDHYPGVDNRMGHYNSAISFCG